MCMGRSRTHSKNRERKDRMILTMDVLDKQEADLKARYCASKTMTSAEFSKKLARIHTNKSKVGNYGPCGCMACQTVYGPKEGAK